MKLRDYQEKALDDLRAELRVGAKRILHTAPTGSGKGTMAAYMIQRAVENGHHVHFWVNRRELVKDMDRRLDALGLDHGIIMANHPRRKPWLKVHIASIDSLHRRQNPPKATLIFIDEAHFANSPVWLKTLEKYPRAAVIGLTATPIRLDGKGLGRIFDKLVLGPSVADLTAKGYLVPTRTFAPSQPDLGDVKTTGGDYNLKQLAEAADKPSLTGDIVEHWLKLGRGRPTVAFAVDIKHSNHIVGDFTGAGAGEWAANLVRAVHVDADTPDDVRDNTWEALAAGDIEVVSSVGIISYGWDCPPVSCAILARPTQSLGLHLQQCGRTLRPYLGKDYSLLLDHAGNHLRHGFVDDPREWSLEDRRRRSNTETVTQARLCKHCFAAFHPSRHACPYCGWEVPIKEREIEHRDGSLEEIKPERWFICDYCQHKGRLPDGAGVTDYSCPRCQSGPLRPIAGKYDPGNDARRREMFMKWHTEQQRNGYKPAYAKVRFKALFGSWPTRQQVQEWTA